MTKKPWYADDSHGPWSDFATNASNFLGNEMVMDDSSLNQRACVSTANVATAGVGAGAMVGGAAASAGESMISAGQDFNEYMQGLSDPHTGIRPYTAYRDEDAW